MSGLRLPVPRPGRIVAATAIGAALAVAGCGSGSATGGGSAGGSGGSAAKGASLTVADVAPFTGTDAALRPTYLVSCDAATNAINKAEGVLGHKLGCKSVDTRGDPADAVPAVSQVYAST
jgi:ABC-type branched-subunit amino acid transport system substrate-binding protein